MQEKIAPAHGDDLSPDRVCVRAGETVVRHVRFLAADGSSLDLSDPRVSIRWQIITPDGVEMLIKNTGDAGVTIISAADGLVRLVLTPRETRRFAPGVDRDIARVTMSGGLFARSTGRWELLPALP